MLVFGSSVSAGYGASDLRLGWAYHLAKAAEKYNIKTVNQGVPGTFLTFWQRELSVADRSHLTAHKWLYQAILKIIFRPNMPETLRNIKEADIVVLSVSCGNEGFAQLPMSNFAELEQNYIAGLHKIAQQLREMMNPGSRLVIGGPYPNGGYGPAHLEVLQRILVSMRSWSCVDHVIDFLDPVLHAGEGRWHPGSFSDAGHPNDKGHVEMFHCLNVEALLGQYAKSDDAAPLQRHPKYI